jgi:hypothetical protein
MIYDGKLLFYTNFYKYQTIAPYCKSLIETMYLLYNLGINCDYKAIRGDFHIERALNDTLSRFMEDETATDLMMIDSDESWDAKDIVKLLLRPEEVVTGTYVLTNGSNEYVSVLKTDEDGSYLGKILEDGNALLEALRVPGGFMRIKRSALKKIVDKNPDDYFDLPSGKAYKFFWNEINNHQFIGMDYAFSDKLRDAGVQLWVDPTIKVSHWGIKEYPGDLDKRLRELKAEQDKVQ